MMDTTFENLCDELDDAIDAVAATIKKMEKAGMGDLCVIADEAKIQLDEVINR